MLLIGLTGGIASGKTLVRRFFEDLGARTIDADEVSRELVSPGSVAGDRIAAGFGREYFNPDGTLNRGKLADLIFDDPVSRVKLETILHPLIADEIAARIRRYAEEDPEAIVVVDAALLVETGMYRDFDKLVVVYATEEARIERLMARDGIARSEAYRRIASQLPLEAKLNVADYVVNNSSTPEDTRREAMKIFNRIKRP